MDERRCYNRILTDEISENAQIRCIHVACVAPVLPREICASLLYCSFDGAALMAPGEKTTELRIRRDRKKIAVR